MKATGSSFGFLLRHIYFRETGASALYYPEDKGIRFLRNIYTCLPNFTVSHIKWWILNRHGTILFACLFLVFLFVLTCCSWYAVFTLWNVTRPVYCLLWNSEQYECSGFRYSCCQISKKFNFHCIQINILLPMLIFSRQFWRVKLAQIPANSQLCPHRKHTQLLPHEHSTAGITWYITWSIVWIFTIRSEAEAKVSTWWWAKWLGVGKFSLGSMYNRVYVH